MTLKATIGATDANSYVTQAEANAYFLNRAYSSAWEDFEQKDEILILSSQMLDWYIKWKGVRYSTTQYLLWPRTGVIRRDGTTIDSDIIPNEVKLAVYELAISSMEEDRMVDDPLSGIEQLRAGSLMIKAGQPGFNSTAKEAIPEKIYKILSDLYIRGGGSVVRLLRA